MPSFADALRRLWQPRKPLFWLVVGFQILSSALVLFIQIHQPPAGLRLVLGLLALTNTVLGWWLLARLWREGGAD
jgi:4-hydroxybenzoate polyprenyltransferase